MDKTINLIYILLILFTIGCNRIEFKSFKKDLPFEIQNRYENNFNNTDNSSLINWYKNFNDINLNQIVDKTIKNNLDVKIAVKKILEAKYNLLKTRSNLFPQIDLSGSFNRQRQSYKYKEPSGKEITVSNTSNSFSMQIMASYEIDLWNKLSYERELAKLELLKIKENKEIVLQSIVSQCINLYFSLCATIKKIKFLESKKEILKNLYTIYNKKFQSGLISYFQLRYYYNLLIDNDVQLKNLLKEKNYLEQNLNTLMANYPKSNNIKTSPFEIDIKDLKLPSLIPSDLLKRRPDIRYAILEVKSKLTNLGYAKALKFPSINLSADIGYLSDKLSYLTNPESQIWSISSSLLYPLFNAGKLKYNQKKSEEALYESILNYQKTVLNAFFEVESTLMKRKNIEKIYKDLKKQLKIKQEEFILTQKKYKKGLCSVTDLYERELDVINKKLNLLDTKLQIVQNQILLFKVLGGAITK